MSRKRKSMVGMVMALIAVGLFLPALISGGDLEPSAPPGQTMRTLEEIYDALVDNYCPDPSCPNCDGAPVAATGQTTSYGAGTDGDLQKGVPWPNPRFTDNGDGTVTDNLTGLVWLKNADCFGLRTWDQALSDANGLASGSCGLSDNSSAGEWRLPNLNELRSLIDYGRFDPALPSGHPFTGVQTQYWSSTTQYRFARFKRGVNLYNGDWVNRDKDEAIYVFPVRGGN